MTFTVWCKPFGVWSSNRCYLQRFCSRLDPEWSSSRTTWSMLDTERKRKESLYSGLKSNLTTIVTEEIKNRLTFSLLCSGPTSNGKGRTRRIKRRPEEEQRECDKWGIKEIKDQGKEEGQKSKERSESKEGGSRRRVRGVKRSKEETKKQKEEAMQENRNKGIKRRWAAKRDRGEEKKNKKYEERRGGWKGLEDGETGKKWEMGKKKRMTGKGGEKFKIG